MVIKEQEEERKLKEFIYTERWLDEVSTEWINLSSWTYVYS